MKRIFLLSAMMVALYSCGSGGKNADNSDYNSDTAKTGDHEGAYESGQDNNGAGTGTYGTGNTTVTGSGADTSKIQDSTDTTRSKNRKGQ